MIGFWILGRRGSVGTLSSKVQLRGQYPLGFFFLDEGFGTLDEEKLDAVIGALERLHDRNRLVGVIKDLLLCRLSTVHSFVRVVSS